MKPIALLITASLLASPAHAAEWTDARTGAFVGARLTIGGHGGGRAQAALTLAPTQTRTADNGIRSMKIGEGMAFNLSPGAKPTLTLAGVRADTMLGLHRNGRVDSDRKLGISDGGWVAIGVGVIVLAGGIFALHRIKEADENSD